MNTPHSSYPVEKKARGLQPAWQQLLLHILWWEPFWVALLAPSLLFPGRFWVPSLQPLWVLLLFAPWPLRLLAGAWRRSPLDLCLFCLLWATAVALAVSPAPASSWEAAGYLLLGLAACTALLQWPPLQDRPQRAAWILLAGGALIGAAGPLLLGGQAAPLGLAPLLPAFATRWAGALGDSVNPNVLGGALLVPAVLAASLAVGPRWSAFPLRPLWVALAAVLAVEVLLLQSRGAWIGLAAGFLLLLVLRWPRSGWLLLPLAALGLFLLVMGGGLALAFDSIGVAGARGALGMAGEGLSDRLAIWQAALLSISQQPLTGIGLGLFGPWVDQHGLLAATPYWQPHAHNLLLQVAADLGLPGLAAYGGLLLVNAGMLVALLLRRPVLRRSHGRHTRTLAETLTPPGAGARPVRIPAAAVYRLRLRWTLAAGSAAALAGLLVHGLVDAALWGNKAAVVPWLLLALIGLLFLAPDEVESY